MTEMPPPPTAGTSNDDKNIATLTHASGILLGFIVPLIVWLIKKDQSPYLAEQAKEALNFQITVAIAYIACAVLLVILIGGLLMPLVWIGNLIFCILAAVATSKGENYKYPIALRLIS